MRALEVPGGVLVDHAMTRDVVVVGPDVTLWAAARMLRDAGISGMPVVDRSQHLVGVLSEKDIARAVAQVTGSKRPARLLDLVLLNRSQKGSLGEMTGEALQNTTVAEVMSRDPVVTSPTTALDTAAGIMLERRINRLPVVDGGRLVGILTRHDVLAASV